MLKRLTKASATQQAIGTLGAWYLRLVWKTSRFTLEPSDIFRIVEKDLPVIVAMWHGQHFMMPFANGPKHRVKSLISMHRDGEINAIAAEKLGVGTIRGSGSHTGEFHRKGGPAAFKQMLEALAEGYNIALTADVPKVARRAGLGIVKLAQHSGRLIFPAAIATSRRVELENWDRTAVNLPFSRGAIVAGDPIRVPADADNAMLEQARRAVEDELNRVTARAYQVADGGD
ncbi:MAG TPA: lysophospholipid acyltransferase family protein [Pseudolabrys sp.]|nr:lysophospholipid acyltransferase family protein [Pseudolabrys sp.]